LNRAQFLSLFLGLQKSPLDLLPQLSEPAARYFQQKEFKPKVRVRSADKLMLLNPYLQSDEAYLRTRANLPEGVFLTADLFNLPLQRKFDVVYLANVLDFNRARSAQAVESLWPLVEPSGCICSYEFASHRRRDGEYGQGLVTRHEFDGLVYGGRDNLGVISNRLTSELVAIGQGGQSSHLYRSGEVVLRAPRVGTKVDAQASFRSHHLMHLLAGRIGRPGLALPATLVDTPQALRGQVASPQMVASPHLPAGYRNAHSLPARLLAEVSEDDRLAAALLCVLTAQCDAVLKNVFLSPEGKPVLLDLDTCLGRPVWWGPASRSCFVADGKLAFASRQDGLADLPAPLAALIREVLSGSELGLTADEARALSSCARAILEQGLTRAAQRPLPEPVAGPAAEPQA
jgi:SAM-dependent methyltransferase